MIPIIPGWDRIPASQLVGVSDDLDEIDGARALAESLGRIDCLFIQGNENGIPWRDAYFDVAHLAGTATAEVRRVLGPDGTIHECQSTY